MNELRTMHLFAGIGGGLLADLILGHKPVVAVEWEPYACRVLRERAAEGWFPGLHVWEGDVRLFDPSEYTGSVDCIHAGFPCQDISVAGKQAGVSEGTRSGLYREVLRIAGVVRPRYLFLENVSAILSNGLGTVLADLAALGYDSRWMCIRASDVGSNHHRDRWFLLADTEGEGLSAGRIGGGQAAHGEVFNMRPFDGCCDEDVADTECKRLQGSRESKPTKHPTQAGDWEATQFINGGQPDFWRIEPGLGGLVDEFPNRICTTEGEINANATQNRASSTLPTLPKNNGEEYVQREVGRFNSVQEKEILQSGLHGGSDGQGGDHIGRPEKSLKEVLGDGMQLLRCCGESESAPHRQQSSEQRTGKLDDSMRVMPHEMALGTRESNYSWWETEPNVGRVATGIKHRVGQLKGYGNAQVPLQAAAAWRMLGGC